MAWVIAAIVACTLTVSFALLLGLLGLNYFVESLLIMGIGGGIGILCGVAVIKWNNRRI